LLSKEYKKITVSYWNEFLDIKWGRVATGGGVESRGKQFEKFPLPTAHSAAHLAEILIF
jgi:hypothetical protein